MQEGYARPGSSLFPISYLLVFTLFFMFSIMQFTILFFKRDFRKLHLENRFGGGALLKTSLCSAATSCSLLASNLDDAASPNGASPRDALDLPFERARPKAGGGLFNNAGRGEVIRWYS